MKRWKSLVAALDSLDPVHHLGDPGVDPGVVGVGAADAPRHDADLHALVGAVAVEQRAAGITL